MRDARSSADRGAIAVVHACGHPARKRASPRWALSVVMSCRVVLSVTQGVMTSHGPAPSHPSPI
eukprot:1197600-Prymnesium_polylepis.1